MSCFAAADEDGIGWSSLIQHRWALSCKEMNNGRQIRKRQFRNIRL